MQSRGLFILYHMPESLKLLKYLMRDLHADLRNCLALLQLELFVWTEKTKQVANSEGALAECTARRYDSHVATMGAFHSSQLAAALRHQK